MATTSARKLAGDPSRTIPAAIASPCLGRALCRTSEAAPSELLNHSAGAARRGSLEVRTHPVLSLLAASLIAFAPVHAAARTQTQDAQQAEEQQPTPEEARRAQEQEERERARRAQIENAPVRERPHPDYRPLGMRLGSFDLNASLDLGVASTDNLFADDSGAELDDIIYTVAPAARLASDWARHSLAFDAGAVVKTHDEFSNEDADSYFARGAGRLDVGVASTVTAVGRFAHEVDPRTDPDSPFVGEPVEYDRANLSLDARHEFGRFAVGGGVGYNEYEYDGAQSFRDNEQNLVRARLEADVAPRIGLVLQATADERDYGNSPNLNSDGRTVMVGATLDTDLMRGEVSVGQFERDYDDPALGTFDGLAAAGELQWYVTRLTTITFDAQRHADDNVSATVGQPYVRTEYGARVDHELLRNVILFGGLRSGERDYDSIARNDDYLAGEVGVDYLLNRNVALRGRYEYDELDSTVVGRDYEVNTFSVGLSLRL
jgi:hypothetical protein